MTFLKKIFISYGVIFVLIIVFILGWAAGNKSLPIPNVVLGNNEPESGKVIDKDSVPPAWLSDDVDFNIFWQVWQLIQSDYVDKPVAEPQLFYGAMHGLVASLGDPYSNFLEPQIAEDFAEELAGRFEGIGAEIGLKNDRLTIISPLPESPAEKSGLKGGDKVFAIDDFDTTGISLNDAVSRIRGERGTKVILNILRSGESDFRDITITRDTIKIVSVRQEMKTTASGKNIAYIKITNFHADTSSRFRQAVNESLNSGAEGFIIDVRNNPGGFLDKAIELTSYWVPQGKIVVQEKFSENNVQSHIASGSPQLNEFNTVVLVNGGSASASEILAGALQDHGLATLIGEQTFGKGSVQDLKEFANGSALKLTIARWLTPNGRQIDGDGITPDIEIELTEDDYNADLDPQLDKALEILDN